MIHVLLNVYSDVHSERNQELRRVENLWRDRSDICLHVCSGRPTFDALFDLGRAVVSSPLDICVLPNSDCYLDESNTALLEHMAPGEFWCLSRWDVRAAQDPSHFGYEFSQDVWAWRGTLDPRMLAPFTQGTPACDGALAYRAHALGYTVRNPSLTVKAHHYHETGVRRWQDKPLCPGPHKYVKPTSLLEVRPDSASVAETEKLLDDGKDLLGNKTPAASLVGMYTCDFWHRGEEIRITEKAVERIEMQGFNGTWALAPNKLTLRWDNGGITVCDVFDPSDRSWKESSSGFKLTPGTK